MLGTRSPQPPKKSKGIKVANEWTSRTVSLRHERLQLRFAVLICTSISYIHDRGFSAVSPKGNIPLDRRGFASPRLRGEGSACGRTSGAKRSGGEGAVQKEAPSGPQRLPRRRPLTLACFAGLPPSAALSPQAGRGENPLGLRGEAKPRLSPGCVHPPARSGEAMRAERRQCRIWLRKSLVRSCCGFLKNSSGVFISTICP